MTPLRTRDQDEYLQWAVEAYRHATSGASDRTQIHSHMCYAEFGDILDTVSALDADVISLEATRSGPGMIEQLASQYRAAIGPGVYDIHAPLVPTVDDLRDAIARARTAVPGDRLWVNPDCGLKTREWAEVEYALRNMVAAASSVRGAEGP